MLREFAFDKTDLLILDCLQQNARIANVELAERVHLSPSQCLRRLRRLEQLGAVRRYVALLEPAALGLGVMAFVSVTLERHGEAELARFHQIVAQHPAILEGWAVTGDSDYLLRVVARDLESFSELLLHELLRLPMVAGVKSTILLRELKSTTALPLPGGGRPL